MRACFVHALLAYLGPSALLLDGVWEVYEEAPQWLLNQGCRKRSGKHEVRFTSHMMSDFASELPQLPAADPKSVHAQCLQAMKVGCHAFLLKSKVHI